MRKALFLLNLLFPLALAGQQIDPSQIKPGTNGQQLVTAGGKGAWGNPTAAGVSSVTPGTGVSCSPLVAGSCTGAVTVTNTGSFNPPTTNYVWVGDSRLMVATTNTVAATAASMDGTTVTVTLPNIAGNWVDNAALVAGDSIQFAGTWAPACLSSGNATVITASATQVTVAENSLGPVTCTGSASGVGGTVQKANYFVPQATAREPYFNGHGTTYNMAVSGQTAAGLATQYTAFIHPLSPAVTGNSPAYLFIQAGSQDALGCSSAGTIETALQNYWATAHADGWTVVMTTLITGGPTISCASDGTIDTVNYWLRSQVKGYDQTLTTANKYWDQLVDIAEYVGDLSDQNIFATGSINLHFNNGGTKVVSSIMNAAMVAKGSVPPTPRAGYSIGERISDGTGSFGASRGFGAFAAEAWSGNTTSGRFSFGIDHANTSSPVGAFWLTGNVGASEDLGAGYGLSNGAVWLTGYTGGYCWKNGTGGAFLSQQGTDSCFKRIAANEVALGNGTSSTDFSGQLDLTRIKMAATAPVGSCTGFEGAWELTQDKAITVCDATSHTWTAFGGGSSAFNAITSGTNTTAAMVVGSGASLAPTGTGTIQATNIASTIAAGSGTSITGSGTTASPYTIAVTGSGPASNVSISVANAGTTGTTLNTLTKLTGAPSTAVIAATTDTGGVIGITTAGAGTTSNATIQINGLVNCVFSNATTAGDYIQISGTTAGNCLDAGATYPTSGQVIGRVLTTNVGAGTYQVDLFPAEIKGASGGSSAFSALTGGTNTTAAMVVGSGASIAPTGTGTIQATNVASTITAGTNITITGSGTTASPYSIASSPGTRQWSCQPGLGDGLNAIASGTYLESTCMNTTGSTVTLTGISCFTDNAGTSTLNAAGNTLGALLTGAVTCSTSFAAGTQSANVALTNGDYIKFTFVADGTSKQTTWVVKGTY